MGRLMVSVLPSPFRERTPSLVFALSRARVVFSAALFLLLPCAIAQKSASPQKGAAPSQQPAPPSAAQVAAQAAAQEHAQKVQVLLKRAEDSYQSGVSNYNANRLDAARLDFDFAVDSMLSSDMDLK